MPTLVADLKAAGLGVGVLVLVGAGGTEWAERHVGATVDLLGALDLGAGDLVALLDANESRDSSATLAVPLLTGAVWAEQQAEFKRRLMALRSSRGFKVAPYSFEKQGGV